MKRFSAIILFVLSGVIFSFGNYSITKFTDPSFCVTSFPTSYFTSSFSIAELTINGKNGFKKGQTNKVLTLGFNNTIFKFNPGVGNVTATGTEITINGFTITATAIIVNITSSGWNQELNTISFTGIQVRATSAGSSFIARTGGTQTFLIDNASNKPSSTTSWGTLTSGTPLFYSANSTTQPLTSNVFINSFNNQIISTQIVIGGTCGSSLTATSFIFNTSGTGLATQNPTTNITTAKLYYSGTSSIFSTASLFGTSSSPNGTFAITGNQGFSSAGTYYFWLTYDISSGANNGDIVDAQFVSVAISGNTNTAVSGNPSGTRTINNNVFYSRDASVWSNNTTKWSTSSGGAACGCVPTASSAVFVSHATSLDINSPSLAQVTIQNGGILTDANRNLTATDFLETTGNGNFQATNPWTINNIVTSGSGLSTITQSLNLTGDLTVGGGTTLQLTGGAGKDLTVNGNIFVDGVLALGTSNGTSSNAIGTYIAGSGSITGSGTITFGVVKNVLTGSNLTISPVIALTNGNTITNYGAVTMQNNITGGNSTSKWVNESNSVLNMGGTTSAVLTIGILDASAVPNTVNYSGSGTQSLKTPLNSIYYNFYTSNAGTKTMGAALEVDGDLSIAGTAELSAGANNIDLYGNWINNSSNATTFNSSGTVFFDGSNDTISGTGITSFNIVDITSSGVLTANSSTGKVIVTGNWINDGDFAHNSSDITFNGTTIISGASTTNFNSIIVNTTKALTLHATETDMEGDLTVNGTGTLNHNSGLISFGGNGNTQNINGNTTLLTFYQFDVSNPGGNITLARPVTINSLLSLTSGYIVTTTTNILTLIDGSSSTSGSSSSFVSGPMIKIGAGAFTFPVGKGGRWARIGTGAALLSNTFRAEYFNAAYSNTASMAALPSPTLNHVSKVEYWELDRTSGISSAIVTLFWEDASYSGINDCSTSDLRIAHWNGSTWENNNDAVSTGGGCVGASSGSIATNSSVLLFSPFTFGSKSALTNPLPIELLNFEGSCNAEKNAVELNWITATERNSSDFILERSPDGAYWTKIAKVSGAGNSVYSHKYFYSDVNYPPGLYYYRLLQEDIDGTQTPSKAIAVACNPAGSNYMQVQPNPAKDAIIVNVSLSEDNPEPLLKILDATGRICFEQSLNSNKGVNAYNIPVTMAPGVYNVTVVSGGMIMFSRKLVVM